MRTEQRNRTGTQKRHGGPRARLRPPMRPSSFGNSPLVMRLIEIFFMSFLLDRLAQTTINAFLGDRPHAAPGELQYIRYGTDADADARVHISVLPPKPVGSTRFVIVSDTHERHEKLVLPPGDVLIHCGDVLCCSKYLSTRSGVEKLHAFNDWLSTVPCPTKLVIGGNHDSVMETIGKTACQALLTNALYLENEPAQLGKLKLFASPLSSGKSGNKAFQSGAPFRITFYRFETSAMATAPDAVDILLTHGHCPKLEGRVRHAVHVWGHNHNSYGVRRPPANLKGHPVRALSICAPIMDRKFNPAHLPVVLDVPSEGPLLRTLPGADGGPAANAADDRLPAASKATAIGKVHPSC